MPRYTTRRAGSDLAQSYYAARTQRVLRGADGLGRMPGRLGMYMPGTVAAADQGPIRSSAGSGVQSAAAGYPPDSHLNNPDDNQLGAGLMSAGDAFPVDEYLNNPMDNQLPPGIHSGAAGNGIQSVTASSPNGGAVITSTSPGGTTDTSAPGVTPPSVLKTRLAGTKGALGFLTWAKLALPAPIAQAVLQAAIARSISYRNQGGQLGVFGDTSVDDSMTVDPSMFITPDVPTIDPSVDLSNLDLTAVASNAAPSSTWTAAMSNTVASAAASLLSTADAATVTSLANTNLMRAGSGQAPLAVAAGAGIGATAAGSNKTLLWGGAVVGVILLLMAMSKK